MTGIEPSIDRLPPHSPEAEQGVLGSILLSPNECMGQCVLLLKDGAESFYDLCHQTIYVAMLEMYEDRQEIDLITLQQRLKDKQRLEAVGGIAYLATLQDATPSAANLTHYTEIVAEKWMLRKLVRHCTEIVSRVYDSEESPYKLLESAGQGMMNMLGGSSKSHIPINTAVRECIGNIEAMFNRQGQLLGISTGFADIDKMTQGLHPGEMTIIAGRPSVGKSALAMNIVDHVAVGGQIPVGVFSLEMTIQSLVMRMLCSRAMVDSQHIRDGYLTERDFPKLIAAAGKIGKSPLYIDDSSGLSIIQLRSKARQMQQLNGIKLLVVDYLQLLHGRGRKGDSRQNEMAEISTGLKEMAKELSIPVIVLSQLNRDMEKGDRPPRLSDLRDTGQIEQDADVVHLLYKPDPENDYAVTDLIAKQRCGPTGPVHLTFLKQSTRFESAAPEAAAV